MEQYRKNLRTQSFILAVVAIACIAVVILGFSGAVTPTYADEHWADFWNGLYSGIATGIGFMSILGIVMNCIALKDEKKLKKRYIKDNDERKAAIWEKAGGQSYWFIAGGLVAALVISGYFSPVVCVTILGCLLYFCLVRLGLKLYYSKKI